MRTGLAAGAFATLAAALAAMAFAGHSDRARAAPAAHDGPFGIYMGEPLSALGKVTRSDPGFYVVTHPPRPSDSVPWVSVQAYASTGVCAIMGMSDFYDDDPSGSQAIGRADSLAAVLEGKYGPGEKYDSCDGDEDDCGANWARTEHSGSARYGYEWKPDQARLPDGVRLIRVAAVAVSATSTHAVVGYLSSNESGCSQAQQQSGAASPF